MATLQDLLNSGELQLYQTVTVSNASSSADVEPISLTVLDGTALSTAQSTVFPDFIPATMDPRVTPVIIFG
jgi:hypothetical protein